MTTNRAQVPAAAGVSAGARLPLSATERTRHRRLWHLGRADRESLHAVLRAGLVAHLGVIIDGWPMVIPTVYGFDAQALYLHGSVASQSLNTAGTPSASPSPSPRGWCWPGRCSSTPSTTAAP